MLRGKEPGVGAVKKREINVKNPHFNVKNP